MGVSMVGYFIAVAGLAACVPTVGLGCAVAITGAAVGVIGAGAARYDEQECEERVYGYDHCDTGKPGVIKDKSRCECRCADGFDGKAPDCKQKCPGNCQCNILKKDGLLVCQDGVLIPGMTTPMPDACKDKGEYSVLRKAGDSYYCCPPFVATPDNLCPDYKY
jgi:hypothetical protein